MDKNKNMVILSIKSNILFEIVLVLNEKKIYSELFVNK